MIAKSIDISFYEIIRPKIGDKEAEAVVNFVDAKLNACTEGNLDVLATKEDITGLKLQLAGIKAETAGVKKDLRWLYAILMPLLLAILGLYFKN